MLIEYFISCIGLQIGQSPPFWGEAWPYRRQVFWLISVARYFPSKSRIPIYESSRETEAYWMLLSSGEDFWDTLCNKEARSSHPSQFGKLVPSVLCLQSRCWRAPTQCVFCKLCTEVLCLVWDIWSCCIFSLEAELFAYPGIEQKKTQPLLADQKEQSASLPNAWVMPQPGAGLFVKSNSNKKSKQTSEQNRNQN